MPQTHKLALLDDYQKVAMRMADWDRLKKRGVETIFARVGPTLRADMDRHHPMDRPHAYLWFLGVAPAAQGRGVGSALLRAANARNDAAGLPAYLETGTTRNVALSERHGFKVISQHKARADAPNMWSMWRDVNAVTSV